MSKLAMLVLTGVVMVAMWAGQEYLGLPVGGPLASIFGTDEPSVAECAEGFEDELRTAAPEYAPFVRDGALREAATEFCAELAARPGSRTLTKETGPAFVRQMLAERPHVYRELCGELVDVDFAATEAQLAYVTAAERRRYRRKFCRLSVRYLRPDEPKVDLAALLHDHPRVWSPICASAVQTEAARDPQTRKLFSERQLTVITRRACAQAVRSGVIDVSGPLGFRDMRIDERAFRDITTRIAADVTLGE